MAFHLGLQKNPKIIALALILLVLGVLATMLATQCQFFNVCRDPNYNPAIITGQE